MNKRNELRFLGVGYDDDRIILWTATPGDQGRSIPLSTQQALELIGKLSQLVLRAHREGGVTGCECREAE